MFVALSFQMFSPRWNANTFERGALSPTNKQCICNVNKIWLSHDIKEYHSMLRKPPNQRTWQEILAFVTNHKEFANFIMRVEACCFVKSHIINSILQQSYLSHSLQSVWCGKRGTTNSETSNNEQKTIYLIGWNASWYVTSRFSEQNNSET